MLGLQGSPHLFEPVTGLVGEMFFNGYGATYERVGLPPVTVFGIPGPICQFTGGLFKAMYSLMGIRHAKSVAYLSRFNGWAEVAQS